MRVHLAYVVPVHDEQQLLEQNLGRIAERLADHPSARVIVVENGSTDASWEIACRFAEVERRVEVLAFREPVAGLGHAYDRALRELEALPVPAGYEAWVLLGAADLPFGFTDLDAALEAIGEPDCPPLLLGSKAHPESRLHVSSKRRAASVAYRWLRRALLGMRVGDCQGSTIVRADLASFLRPFVRSRDYFYTTELVFFAERVLGLEVRELPVSLAPDERKSTVSLVRDGMRMGLSLVELRRRARRGGDVPTEGSRPAHWTAPAGVPPSRHER